MHYDSMIRRGNVEKSALMLSYERSRRTRWMSTYLLVLCSFTRRSLTRVASVFHHIPTLHVEVIFMILLYSTWRVSWVVSLPRWHAVSATLHPCSWGEPVFFISKMMPPNPLWLAKLPTVLFRRRNQGERG